MTFPLAAAIAAACSKPDPAAAVMLVLATGQVADLLGCLTHDTECRLDRHGGCQEHRFLSLEPGERCPNAEARELLVQLQGVSR